MDDVADAEAMRPAGVVDDDQTPIDGEIGGHAEQFTVRQFDADTSTDRRQLAAVTVTQFVR